MKKFYNILFVIIFILFASGVSLFNKNMDPFGLNIAQRKGNVSMFYFNHRDLMYPQMCFDKASKYQIAIIGSSASKLLFRPIWLEKKIKENTAILILDSILPEEQYNLIKDYLDLHPETKNIFVELHFESYYRCFDSKKDKYKKTSRVKDFFKFYLSIDATKKSIEKFLNEKAEKKEKIASTPERSYVLLNPYLKIEYDKYCARKNVPYLRKIVNLIEKRKVNCTFFVPPVHSLHMANSYKLGYYKNIQETKKLMAEIVPYYDMSFSSKYTNVELDCPNCFYFHDVLHPTFVNLQDILDIIFYKKDNEEFSVLLNKDNVEKELLKQEFALKLYMEENKDLIEKYINSNDYREKRAKDAIEKIFYIDKLPDEIKNEYDIK